MKEQFCLSHHINNSNEKSNRRKSFLSFCLMFLFHVCVWPPLPAHTEPPQHVYCLYFLLCWAVTHHLAVYFCRSHICLVLVGYLRSICKLLASTLHELWGLMCWTQDVLIGRDDQLFFIFQPDSTKQKAFVWRSWWLETLPNNRQQEDNGTFPVCWCSNQKHIWLYKSDECFACKSNIPDLA